MRGLLDHAKYLGKEVWATFYDIEKCFDSLWLQDCINSLWENGIKDDILSLVYFLNTKANIAVKSSFGKTKPFICSSIVKQGTVLEPVLNNCSLDRIPVESHGFFLGSVEIKPIEFVDDIANPNEGQLSAQMNNKIIEHIHHEKRLMFSEEKCELLKVNSKVGDATIQVNAKSVKTVRAVRYLGDHFNFKGNNKDLCKERVKKATETIIELMALSRETCFGIKQTECMLILYRSMFLPRLIYNCEAWSNITKNDYETLKSLQLNYLRSIMELPKGAPIAALYLELGILPIKYETEMRQILYLKKVLRKKPDDPVLLAYREMLKFDSEDNWANNLLGLRKLYNLPLNDENVKKMKTEDWKLLVKNTLKRDAFLQLEAQCLANRKTCHLSCDRLKAQDYLLSLDQNVQELYSGQGAE